MYIAELKGKLPSTLEGSEDILTSNVFSFFKYANRTIYLKHFLLFLDLNLNEKELETAEFIFWPRLDDGTEPDLIILAGKYYLLFEAKLHSDFSNDTENDTYQLTRELIAGKRDADTRGLIFKIIAITKDSCCPSVIYEKLSKKYKSFLYWSNWQKVASLLLDQLEEFGGNASNYLFAEDLYRFLDHRNLRRFISFERLSNLYKYKSATTIFLPAKEMNYRGYFVGFENVLSTLKYTRTCQYKIFFQKTFFSTMPNLFLSNRRKIFFRR